MNKSDQCCGTQNTSVNWRAWAVHHLGAPVALFIVASLMLGLYEFSQLLPSIVFTANALWGIAPFLLLSVVLAAGLKASGADKIVAQAFSGHPVRAIIVASMFGAVSPFCSCGVVPIVAGLLIAGVPLAPVMAFCLASPIMDPEMFILTAAALGIEFAVVKTMSAMMIGMMAGFVTLTLAKVGWLDNVLRDIAKPSCSDTGCGPSEVKQDSKVDWGFWRQPEKRALFSAEAGTMAWFLGRWLAFAFLLESLMVAYVPGALVASWLGGNNAWAIPMAAVAGVPAYLNGYAAIPMVRGLIDLGMAPATGLAFMLAGSITSIPAAVAVWTLFKPRLFTVYLGLACIGAVVMAELYSWI